MLSGIASLGVQVPTGLIDDQHRKGAGIDAGTSDEVRRHGVGVAPGINQIPAPFPFAGQIAPKI